MSKDPGARTGRSTDFSSPASQVLRHLRRSSHQSREQLARATGLSPATVARTVSELLARALGRERHELAETIGRGRPRIPIELAGDKFVCIGVHVGKLATTLAVSDLSAELLAAEVLPHAPGRTDPAALPGRIARLLNQCLDRVPLAAAVTGPWDHLPIDPEGLADELEAALGLPVFRGTHIAAMAGVEFIRRGYRARERTLYVYLRNVAGAVTMADADGRVASSGTLDLTHFPTSAQERCDCGRTGCLEVAAGDHHLASRAVAAGVIDRPLIRLLHETARAGDRRAQELLERRAAILGEAVAVLRDLTRPAHLVVLGQAFTSFPEAHPVMRAAYAAPAGGVAVALEISAVGDELQAVAACATALGGVFADPRRVAARR